MKETEFYEILGQEMLETEIIKISITKAKGIITFFWYTSFADYSNIDWFERHFDQINWANQKIEYIAKKYKDLYYHHKILSQRDVEHFDYLRRTTKEVPVKKSWQTNTQSFGGYVQFKLPKENLT